MWQGILENDLEHYGISLFVCWCSLYKMHTVVEQAGAKKLNGRFAFCINCILMISNVL